jgi:hypothetical protein
LEGDRPGPRRRDEILSGVAFAPSHSEVLDVATRTDGVLKSDDGATSWRPANRGMANSNIQQVVVMATQPGGLETEPGRWSPFRDA